MSIMSRPARLLAGPLAGVALVAGGLAAAPVQAEPGPSITTVHIENAAHQPVTGLDIAAQQDDYTPEGFTETSTPGEYEAINLYPGDWTLWTYDDDPVQPYLDAEASFTVNEEGDGQELETITLQVGAVVTGKVTAPSGHAVRSVLVQVEPVKAQEGNWGGDAEVNSKGVFRVLRLKAGTYRISYIVAYEYKTRVVTSKVTIAAGQVLTGRNITKVKVPAALSVSGKSAKKKTATLKVKVKAARALYGITDPGGTVRIKQGSKILKSKVSIKKGVATIKLSKLKKGKRTFTVSYTGGDLNNISKKVTVKVK